MNTAKIILKSGKEHSLERFHPWIFSGAIKNIIGNPAEGDVVTVLDNKQSFLALGHWQSIGSISVRVFGFEEVEPDKEFWKNKFEKAINLRKVCDLINNPHTDVFRLIHGEGDGFPGFICDYYNGTVVFQSHSYGMYLLEGMFAEILKELLGDKLTAVYDKSEKTLPKFPNISVHDKFILGSGNEQIVSENDLKYAVNVVEGQKTGFFIDQRENRKLLGSYSKGKKVLNMFCYTGGFSIAALAGGATSVTSVDASQTAIELVNKNVELNFPGCTSHKSVAADSFEFLDKMEPSAFDLVILDPPAFAKHANVTNQAIKGYQRINRAAMERMASGSILFTFSCSQTIKKEVFRLAVMDAAIQAGKKIKILHQLTQPVDHPISIFHPEGEYLKGLVIYIE